MPLIFRSQNLSVRCVTDLLCRRLTWRDASSELRAAGINKEDSLHGVGGGWVFAEYVKEIASIMAEHGITGLSLRYLAIFLKAPDTCPNCFHKTLSHHMITG